MLFETIKMLRFAECRMSQKEAADYLGYSLRHYQRMEYGHTPTPQPARLALESYAGILHAPRWKKYRLYGNDISTPDGHLIPSEAFRAWSFLQQIYAIDNPTRFDNGYLTPNASRNLSLD